MAKQIDVEITPSVKGSTLKIDGQEISGLQKIMFIATVEAGELTPEIVLEFQGYRINESGDLALKENEDGSKTLDLFVQKIRGYSVTVKMSMEVFAAVDDDRKTSGEFNLYPFE